MNFTDIVHQILLNFGPVVAVWVANELAKLVPVFNGLGPKVHSVVAVLLTALAASATGQPLDQDAVLAAYQLIIQAFFPVQQALRVRRLARGLKH